MQSPSGVSGPLGWIDSGASSGLGGLGAAHIWLAPGSRAVRSEESGKPQRAEQVSLLQEEPQNGQLDRGTEAAGDLGGQCGAFAEATPSIFALKCLWDSLRAQSMLEAKPCLKWGGLGVGFPSTQIMLHGSR